MVSRLILNLRSDSLRGNVHVYPNEFSHSQKSSRTYITSSITGNLGNPVSSWGEEEDDEFEEFEKAKVIGPTQIVVEVTKDVLTDQSIVPASRITDLVNQHHLHLAGSRESWAPPRNWLLDNSQDAVQLQEMRRNVR